MEDLKAVIEYASNLDYADANRVTIGGCSMGGFASAMLAAELKDRIEKLILLYPALHIPEKARSGKMIFFKVDPNNVPDVITGIAGLKVGGDYVRTAQKVDCFNTISEYKGPVVFIHGTWDKLVSPKYTKMAYEAYSDKRGSAQGLDIIWIKRGSHGFKKKHLAKAQNELAKYLK